VIKALINSLKTSYPHPQNEYRIYSFGKLSKNSLPVAQYDNITAHHTKLEIYNTSVERVSDEQRDRGTET